MPSAALSHFLSPDSWLADAPMTLSESEGVHLLHNRFAELDIALVSEAAQAAANLLSALPVIAPHEEVLRLFALELGEEVVRHPKAHAGTFFQLHLQSLEPGKTDQALPELSTGNLTRLVSLPVEDPISWRGNGTASHLQQFYDQCFDNGRNLFLFTAYPIELENPDQEKGNKPLNAQQIKQIQAAQAKMLFQAMAAASENFEARTALVGVLSQLRTLGTQLNQYRSVNARKETAPAERLQASQAIRQTGSALVGEVGKTVLLNASLSPHLREAMRTGIQQLRTAGGLNMPQAQLPRVTAVTRTVPLRAPLQAMKTDRIAKSSLHLKIASRQAAPATLQTPPSRVADVAPKQAPRVVTPVQRVSHISQIAAKISAMPQTAAPIMAVQKSGPAVAQAPLNNPTKPAAVAGTAVRASQETTKISVAPQAAAPVVAVQKPPQVMAQASLNPQVRPVTAGMAAQNVAPPAQVVTPIAHPVAAGGKYASIVPVQVVVPQAIISRASPVTAGVVSVQPTVRSVLTAQRATAAQSQTQAQNPATVLATIHRAPVFAPERTSPVPVSNVLPFVSRAEGPDVRTKPVVMPVSQPVDGIAASNIVRLDVVSRVGVPDPVPPPASSVASSPEAPQKTFSANDIREAPLRNTELSSPPATGDVEVRGKTAPSADHSSSPAAPPLVHPHDHAHENHHAPAAATYSPPAAPVRADEGIVLPPAPTEPPVTREEPRVVEKEAPPKAVPEKTVYEPPTTPESPGKPDPAVATTTKSENIAREKPIVGKPDYEPPVKNRDAEVKAKIPEGPPCGGCGHPNCPYCGGAARVVAKTVRAVGPKLELNKG